VAETAHAEFGEDQRKFACQVLKPREISAEGRSLMEIHIKGGDIEERQFQIFRSRKVRVAQEAVRILILGNVAKILKESFDFLSPIPPNDGWRNLFGNTVNREGLMPPTGGDALSDLLPNLPPCPGVVEKTDMGHPWHVHDDSKTVLRGLIQKGKRRNGIGQDGVDARLPHQREV